MTSSRSSVQRRSSISVVGMGYVGLATAVCFARAGFKVYGVDIDKKKCELIQSGKSPIHEEGIDLALKTSLKNGNFSCGMNVEEAVRNSDLTFVTVGTPSKSNGDIDLAFVESAVSEIGKEVGAKDGYHLVVMKSTVVPGTTIGSIKQILEKSSCKLYPKDFGLCFNPEFLREGSAIDDTIHPDALIVGAEDKRSGDKLLSLYRGFYTKLPRTLVMTTTNAEFVKYSVNVFRATQLSFLNSLANLCEQVPSSDVVEVTRGLNAMTKIDERYLKAGFGFGGSCLPKDLRAFIAISRKQGLEPSLLLSALMVNMKQPLRALDIARSFLGDLNGKRVAVLGLTFKAMTDDIRESVAINIVERFVDAGAKVSVYDPEGMENARQLLHDSVDYADGALSCIKGANCCVIATGWDEFRRIPPSSFRRFMVNPIILDGRRILDQDLFESQGVSVYSIGRYYSKNRVMHLQAEPNKSHPTKTLQVEERAAI
jgi:UDPglucose 6-dehydrogenase